MGDERLKSKVKNRGIGPATGAEVIDAAVLGMLRALETGDGATFIDKITMHRERVGANLKILRTNMQEKSREAMEAACCELSYNALMIGAMQMVSSSYQLQSAIRCGDFAEAQAIADRLEMEYFHAQQELKKACEF